MDIAPHPDLQKLFDAMDAAPSEVPCQNFPDAFFPDYKQAGFIELSGYAKAMCDDCPIKQMCAEYGIKHAEYGIWGGLTESDRARIRLRFGLRLVA